MFNYYWISVTRQMRALQGKCIYTIEDTLDHLSSYAGTSKPEGCKQSRWSAMVKQALNPKEISNKELFELAEEYNE